MNEMIDEDIACTNSRLKRTRDLKEKVNMEIMEFVKKKLDQFNDLSAPSFDNDLMSNFSSPKKMFESRVPSSIASHEDW